ncbi:MAG: c-type cytochrome [Microthrixaceae bacterium]
MTEIPEHLLERSRSRRAALTGEGGADETTAPATTESSDAPAKTESAAPAAAAAAAPAPEPEPEPTPPWVEAAESRQRAPWWAAAALVMVPLFFIVYPWTLGIGGDEEGPLALGGEVYAVSCSACHGAAGGGGVGPALSGGAVVETFPEPADQVTWIALGSSGYQEAGLSSYGNGKPIAGGMPGQEASLSPAEIMEVVLHERVVYGDEEFDAAIWEEGFEEEITALLPDEAEEYMAVLEEWAANPPAG